MPHLRIKTDSGSLRAMIGKDGQRPVASQCKCCGGGRIDGKWFPDWQIKNLVTFLRAAFPDYVVAEEFPKIIECWCQKSYEQQFMGHMKGGELNATPRIKGDD